MMCSGEEITPDEGGLRGDLVWWILQGKLENADALTSHLGTCLMVDKFLLL